MLKTEQPHGDPPALGEPESLSAFVARVLNQLSLSAWLPGAFFIASVSALAWFQLRGAVTFRGASTFIQDNWLSFLILTVPALVIVTLLTQAFSFGAIQTLEGYWRARGPASWLRMLCISRQLRLKHSLEKRFIATHKKAFRSARPRLLQRPIDGMVLLAVEADVNHNSRPSDLSDEQHDTADTLNWQSDCDPWQMARMVRLNVERREFPQEARIMPTKLGNVLRSAEDGIEDGGDLGGFVMRNRHLVPTRVLLHHDQFRTRLDMYCILVFVSAMAAIVSIPVLTDLPALGRISVVLALLVMSWASYGAALASARGYGTSLRQIDSAVKEARQHSTADTPTP